MGTGITILLVFIAVVVTLLIAVPVTRKIAVDNKIKQDAEKIGTAEEKARNIIDEALKTAETKKREALLEAKEESLRTKNEVEKETRERRAELQKYEKRVLSKEESVDKKADVLERRENEIAAKEASVRKKEKEVDGLHEKGVQELERISGFTSEEAKEYLLKSVEDEVKIDTAKLYKELESRAKEEAGRKAKEYVVTAIQKCAVDHVSESTISVVQLPSDEMKGRIIGREGRNIRTLETMTGVDLIIDDTPEAVVLSSFDPIRREVARIALEKLIVDGRIHPARIEEMVEKAQKEVENMIREEGEAATLEVGVHGIHPELVRLLGRMKFRTSYGQNALKHSIEVAQLSGLLAGEIGVDVRMAKRAGLLHDIGKSIDHEVEGSHIQIGADLCKKYKESPLVINAVEAHHGDVEPESLIACIVQAADTISAARPGARRETLETYTNRLKQLEDITNSFKGVDKSFAIQAGREIRIMVVPEQVSDADMVLLARDVAKQIEAELEQEAATAGLTVEEYVASDYEAPAQPNFSIYQVPPGPEGRDFRYRSYEELQADGLSVDRKNYQLIYSAPLDKDITLDEIYRRFNMEHPADYKGHSLSMGDIVVFRQDGKQTAYYVDEGADYRQVPEFFAQPEKQLTPDECMTGEQIQTPRGRFYLTDRSREQMEAAGYGFHHQSEDGRYLIMANGTRAFAIPAQPESHIKTAEMSTEQNYNMIDGMMNNAPSMEELEARAKAGEQISLLDVAEATKAEAKKPKQTQKTTQKQKKPSIRAQLAAAKEEQKKKPPAREKSKEMEV